MAAMQLLTAALLVASVAGQYKYLDLSHDLAADSMRWPTNRPMELETIHKGIYEDGFWLEYYRLKFGEHTSTHIDAPIHFAFEKRTVDQIPLEDLIGPAVVMNITEKVKQNPLSGLSAKDIEEWEKQYGLIPNNAVLFLYTGWGSKYGNFKEYYGDLNDTSIFVFPGFQLDAAQVITNYHKTRGRKIIGVGLDCGSLDVANNTIFEAHVEFATNNMWGLENVANLEQMPPIGAEVSVMPLKTRGGTGGPTRVVAKIPVL